MILCVIWLDVWVYCVVRFHQQSFCGCEKQPSNKTKITLSKSVTFLRSIARLVSTWCHSCKLDAPKPAKSGIFDYVLFYCICGVFGYMFLDIIMLYYLCYIWSWFSVDANCIRLIHSNVVAPLVRLTQLPLPEQVRIVSCMSTP